MKLTVLVDNNTYIDQYYLGEPAVCYYIEDGETRLLLDTGYSDVYIRNAKALGIDLAQVSVIALSHGHNDHTRGLQFWSGEINTPVRIVAHPDAFKERRCGELFIGSPLSESRLRENFELTLSRRPLKISDHITFLGEIPSSNTFEPRKSFVDSNDVCHVGKLVVHPGYQNQGIGKVLMYEIEKYFPACRKFVLFTGEETPNALHLYEKVGYHIVSKENMGGFSMILMEKVIIR